MTESVSFTDYCRANGIPHCELCGSLDVWETPAGAIVCRECKQIERPDEEVEDLFAPDWWQLAEPRDRFYARSPPVIRLCLCCGGRQHHGPYCEELLTSWHRMPWGEHKKLLISVVPSDYLQFVYDRGYGTDEARAMFRTELELRGELAVDRLDR